MKMIPSLRPPRSRTVHRATSEMGPVLHVSGSRLSISPFWERLGPRQDLDAVVQAVNHIQPLLIRRKAPGGLQGARLGPQHPK